MSSTIKNLEQFRKEIEEDAYRYARNIAKHLATYVADDMYWTTYSAIDEFYDNWDPEDPSNHNGAIWYYRHWNFYHSFKRYYKNRDSFYIGGVYLLPENIPDVYSGTRATPEYVFNRVYAGFHGMASCQKTNPQVPTMRPSPMTKITSRFNYIENHIGEYEKKAAEMARKDKYIRLFRKE